MKQPRNNYQSLVLSIDLWQERLAIAVAVCDNLKWRSEVIDRYEAECRLLKIHPFRVTPGKDFKFSWDSEGIKQQKRAVVTAIGIEKLNNSQLKKFLEYLRWTNEKYISFRHPIVLWLTHDLFKEVMLGAWDCWRCNKGLFYLEKEL